jgi:ABC-type uncharacterized transport system auxiliary subunit
MKPPRLAAAAVLAAAITLGVAGCRTAAQVKWETYSPELQDQIDSAAATRNCAALKTYEELAKRTSTTHRKATGVPNDALVDYIHAAQDVAGC